MESDMTIDTELETIYSDYVSAALLAEKSLGPFDGIFGLGKKLADDPCHQTFYQELEKLLTRFADASPESGAVRQALSRICEAPDKGKLPKSVYWGMVAAQGLTLPLIPFLSAEDAAGLLAVCRQTVCFKNPFPAQKQVLTELQKRQRVIPKRNV